MATLLGSLAAALRPRDSSPVPLSTGQPPALLAGLLGRRGVRELEMMGSVSTLFGVVSAISEGAASMAQHWRLERVQQMQRVYGPVQPQRRETLAHPALDRWRSPNPWLTTFGLIETTVQHLGLVGEADWVLASDPRVPSLPLEIWPVRPDRLQPVEHPTEYLTGWVYLGPMGERVPLEPHQVIQIKRTNPNDPYRGLGPVQALLADLDSVRYSAEWNRRFFLNDASPGGVVELEDALSDREFKRFRDRWYEQHRGIGNAHRVAFLERGKWVERQFNMRDMQFVELRNIGRDMIREAFRVHKATLGQSDDVNRANADAADYTLARWNIDPTNQRIAGALNGPLLSLYGDSGRYEFCVDSAAKEDAQTEATELQSRANAYKTLTDAGVDPEDAAAVTGLPPMRTRAAQQPMEVPA